MNSPQKKLPGPTEKLDRLLLFPGIKEGWVQTVLGCAKALKYCIPGLPVFIGGPNFEDSILSRREEFYRLCETTQLQNFSAKISGFNILTKTCACTRNVVVFVFIIVTVAFLNHKMWGCGQVRKICFGSFFIKLHHDCVFVIRLIRAFWELVYMSLEVTKALFQGFF